MSIHVIIGLILFVVCSLAELSLAQGKGELRRVCVGKNPSVRYLADSKANAAGVWISETPFEIVDISEDRDWILGSRSFDRQRAWIQTRDVCLLDSRRVICGAEQTDLFARDEPASRTGRTIDRGELIEFGGFSPRGFARIRWKDSSYWIWQNYLCPVDPNIGTTQPAGDSSPRAAFLATIAFAEGTGDNYDITFGYQRFYSYADHPRRIVCSGELCSDAAGRYQILSSTWDGVRSALGLANFSPRSQDSSALYLMRQRGCKEYDRELSYAQFSAAIYKINREWASLPGSPYGQPTRSMSALWSVYRGELP